MNENLSHPIERRKHPRISLRDTQGVVLIRPGDMHSHSILDISMGGISIIYVGAIDWSDKQLRLDFMDHPCFLEDIPVKIIADIEYENPIHSNAMGKREQRRCSFEFLKLSDDQKRELEAYLAKMEKEMTI